MPKYRIVQVKPEGLGGAYVVEHLVLTPKHNQFNPKYHANQGYWESTFRLNAGGRPIDWFITIPAKEEWKVYNNTSFAELVAATMFVENLVDQDDLLEQAKTFKPKVIKEYD